MRNSAAVLAVLLTPLACGGEVVRFQFTATVDDVYDPQSVIGDAIMVGDTLSGLLQYDLDINSLDEDPDPNYGEWLISPPGDNFLQGASGASGNFQTIDFFSASTTNGDENGDSVSFFATGDTTPSTLEHPDADYVDLDLELNDLDGTVLSNDQLPATLNLADFEEANVYLFSEGYSDESNYVTLYEVSATLTELRRLSGPGPAGDFNGDGAVDAADYTVWRDGLGMGYEPEDYLQWRSDYGATSAATAASAAPEPGALAVALLAMAAAGGRRYWRG